MKRLLLRAFTVLISPSLLIQAQSGTPSTTPSRSQAPPSATVVVTAPQPIQVAVDYAAPSLDGQVSEVENLPISIGHINLFLKKGQASLVMAGGKAVGIHFKGNGTLEYLSTDTSEQPVLRFNLKQNTGLVARTTPDGLLIEEPLEEVTLWFAGLSLPALPAPTKGASELSKAFESHQSFFKLRNSGGTSLPPISHLAALQASNAPGQPLVIAEIAGKSEKYFYAYDEAHARSETFSILKKKVYPGFLFTQSIPLSQSEFGWSQKKPLPPDYALTAVDLDLSTAAGAQARLTVVETVIPIRKGMRTLAFDLNSYMLKQETAGLTKQNLLLRSVTLESGQALAFDHRQNSLLVQFPEAPATLKPIKLRFEIEGDLLVRHGGDEYWELGVESWFPQPDLSGMAYTVHCKMSVEKPYVPVAPGRILKRETVGNQEQLEVVIDKPVCFFSVAAGKYQTKDYTDPRDGVTIHVFGYAGLSTGAEKLAKTVHGFIGYYESTLGKFPFNDLVLLERTELGHGQAPPGLVFITSEAFNPLADDFTHYVASQWINQGVAHEVAHQYWGHVVKMYSSEDQWITESFAEYCSGLAMKQVRGTGKQRYEKTFNRWMESAKRAAPSSDMSHANWLRPGSKGDRSEQGFRTGLVYFKGALILAALHKELGDEGFFNFLSAYQKAYAWRLSFTQNIPDLLKQITGKDYQPFFEKYYWGTAMPDVTP